LQLYSRIQPAYDTALITPRTFYYLVTALFLGLISKSLLSDGMFSDGVIYAVVSRNLASGLGSPWDLHYTSTLYSHFHEHPPMAFWIQALFFRLFGDHLYVERIYSAGTFFITGLCMVGIWRMVSRGDRNLGWLPLLFWVSMPIVTWAASNNLLENTVMIFTCLSVFLIIRGMTGPAMVRGNKSLQLLLAGVILGGGFLTKGFVTLFPLSLPFWIFLFRPGITFRKLISGMLLPLTGTIFFLLMVILLIPGSREYLNTYLDSQVIHSISSVKTVGSRFHVVGTLILSIIPGVALLLVIWLTGSRGSLELNGYGWFPVFLALGLSGVLPIMISLKQRDFYILPALAMMAIAMALAAAPAAREILERTSGKSKWLKVVRASGLLFLAAALFLVIIHEGRTGRDAGLLRDVDILVEEIPEGTSVCIPRALFDNWHLHAYLHRYGRISMDPGDNCSGDYYLTTRDFKETPYPHCIEPVLGLTGFRLFTCSSEGVRSD
jgi:4-amino-4-deoxy-L-arabinose transferase-like glycosyltransferase